VVGEWVHACLESYYRDNDWKIGYNQGLKVYNGLFEEQRDLLDRGRSRSKTIKERLPSVVKRIMQSYEFYYRDEHWQPVIVEKVFEVQYKDIIFKGRVDFTGENEDGEIWLWDHKTATSIPPQTSFHASDPQLILYAWAIKEMWGVEITGVIYNYVKSKAPTIPTLTRYGEFSRRKISTDYPTVYRFLKRNDLDPKDFSDILRPLRGHSDFLRRYRLPREDHVLSRILKESVSTGREINQSPRLYERNITRDCARCAYQVLCRTELEGGDTAYITKKYYRKETDGSSSSTKQEADLAI
jgi:hypothetical protein